MSSFERSKNAILTFLTIGILGGVSGVYLHENNIRLMPALDTALEYPGKIWSKAELTANSLALASIKFFNSDEKAAPEFKGLIVEEPASPLIEKRLIERRLRYISDVHVPDPGPVFNNLKDHWNTSYSNMSVVIDYTLSASWKTLSSGFNVASSSLDSLLALPSKMQDYSFNKAAAFTEYLNNKLENAYHSASTFMGSIFDKARKTLDHTKNSATDFHSASVSGMGKALDYIASTPQKLVNALSQTQDFEFKNILSYEPAAGTEEPINVAQSADDYETEEAEPIIEPDSPPQKNYKYDIEDKTLEIEGVLVPQSSTVISSSRDGQIAKINFDNGDMFQKGDILIEYDCGDLKAELEAAEAEKELTGKRSMRNNKLFKLDIISDIEDLGFKTEDIKASAQAKIIEHRMEQCYIRAAYDGRVTNKLANEHEFTRTDRVLMEVASLDDLEVEFLVPSIWLRWVNIDAPISITVNETADMYDAVINRIYGEIDPVSQSIQMSAKLAAYESPLLPGMSGTITLDVARIRDAGIKGFLEQPRYAGSKASPD